ncbi:G kinase-anchoring protein 1-like isoform X2 [Periplaneta americana]|uniref:G kinase-anchoring protein 1-like isoform X2 n=1 Tax=Periplaneta americana TaxID=6978 RepID=UPI0037E95015
MEVLTDCLEFYIFGIMATAVASRFAVLSIDDDDDFPKRQKKKVENKKPGTGNQKPESNQKKKNKKTDSGKATQTNTNAKSKGKSGKGEGNRDGQQQQQQKKKNASQEQWDQWKKKDSELVDGNYEQDLHQAILLSKLDYEEKKELYEQLKKDAEEEKKNASKKNKKSNKAQPMSLEQFNSLHSEPVCEPAPTSKPVSEQDEEFFERIKDDTKKVLDREQTLELRKAREPFIQEAITIAQFEDTLEKRNKEIKSLKEEVVKLKEELHNVKTRNKKLCNILAQGEMKDKAEVLIEVDRLQRMRDELSSEVSSLHVQLEQERSKVRALTSDPKNSKAQNKKRTASETAQ